MDSRPSFIVNYHCTTIAANARNNFLLVWEQNLAFGFYGTSYPHSLMSFASVFHMDFVPVSHQNLGLNIKAPVSALSNGILSRTAFPKQGVVSFSHLPMCHIDSKLKHSWCNLNMCWVSGLQKHPHLCHFCFTSGFVKVTSGCFQVPSEIFEDLAPQRWWVAAPSTKYQVSHGKGEVENPSLEVSHKNLPLHSA